MFKTVRSILLLTAAVSLMGCSEQPANSNKQPKPRPVKLITLEQAGERQSITYPAVVDAVQSSRLAFQVGGLIETVNVIAAQQVKQGDVLMQLEQRDFQNKLNSAKAQFDTSQSEYTRAKTLVESGVISTSEMEQITSNRDVAKAQLDSAEKALSDTVLKAPFDGIVLEVPVKSLETVQAGTYAVGVMGNGLMEAIINLPASVVARASADVHPEAYVMLDVAPDSPIPATFRRANLEADPSTQTYQVRFAFNHPENLNVLPGMTASVSISFFPSTNEDGIALSVPTFAIVYQNGQHFVWVVDPETMTVTKREITIREGVGESVVITSGLVMGESIVGAGATYLAEGMKVREWVKS